MSTKLSLKFCVLASAMVALAGCGSGGGSGSSSGNTSNSSQGSGGSGGTPSSSTAAWQSVQQQMNSSAGGGSYSGDLMIEVNAVNQTLELILPIPSIGDVTVTPIIPVGVSGLSGVSIGPGTLANGDEAWIISVPLNLILNGATTNSTFNTLPNGDPLPFFPSQEVDGLSISLPSRPGYSVTLYIGVKAVAVFVGIPSLKLPIGFGVNVINSTQTRDIGYFALIPTQGTSPAGVYLAAQIPTDLAQVINSLMVTN